MTERENIADPHGDRIATTEARLEGFYWVILGQNPLRSPTGSVASGGSPMSLAWQPDAMTVLSDKLVFRPRSTPVERSTIGRRLCLRKLLAPWRVAVANSQLFDPETLHGSTCAPAR